MRLKVNYKICAGCRACELACSAKHYKKYSPELSRLRIVKLEDKGVDIPVTCKQCVDAPCVNNCPVNALYKSEETGAIILKKDLCIGCGICVEVCPFSAASLDEDGLAMICDLCGGEPECANVCPVKAIEVQDIGKTAEKKRLGTAERYSKSLLKNGMLVKGAKK